MKKSASFHIVLVLTLLCLAAPLSAAVAAQDPVATVVAVRGTVVAKNTSGVGRTLAIKGQIFQDDVLKTDANGQLQIMFTDNSIISLGRESEMKIAEYRWQAGQKDGALKTQVKEGTFRVMGGALAKDAPQNFKTETPTATIGIRGSMYAFASTRESLSVVFQGGRGIDIFNDLGRVSITTPGFGTHVMLGAPPAPPFKFTEQEHKKLLRQLNGNGGSSDTGEGGNVSALATPPLTAPPHPPLPPINEFPTAPSNLLLPSTNAIINTSFVGSYAGGIQGMYTSNSVAATFAGTYTVTANFTGTPSINGSMNTNLGDIFTNYTMTNVAFTATPTSNSFSATITGMGGTVGSLGGVFYGPAAQTVKGEFSGNDTYTVPIQFNGTFEGKRQ